MNKKKVTRIVLTFAMLLGISIAWAAEEVGPSEWYRNARKHLSQVEAAYDNAQNVVAVLHSSTKPNYKGVDSAEPVWTGLNKYLDRRAEVVKIIQDSLDIAETKYQAWLAYDALSDEEKAKTEAVEKVTVPTVTLVTKNYDGGNGLWLDGVRVDNDYLDVIKADLAEKFTEENVKAFFDAWYYVDGTTTTEEPSYKTNTSGLDKIENSLTDLNDAIAAVEGEDWYKVYALDNNLADDVETLTEALDDLEDEVTSYLENADLVSLQALSANGSDIADSIEALRENLEKEANANLLKALEETKGHYNDAYRTISNKYEGTGELETQQKAFIDNYLSKITEQETAIETAENKGTSCANYAAIVKALKEITDSINGSIEDVLDELEKKVVEANNNLYDNWVAGYDAEGDTLIGSYGNTYAKFIEAATKMNEYKDIANQAEGTTKADALNDLKQAEADLYAQYDSLEANKAVVKEELDSANVDPTERTTTYLSTVIDNYTQKGLEINDAIDECIETACEAVRVIAVDLVKTNALEPMAKKVFLAIEEFGEDEFADVADSAIYYLQSIKVSATKYKADEDGNAQEISDIVYSTWYYNRYGKLILGGYNMLYDEEKSDDNVITADNYQDIIDEITTNVSDSISKYVSLWTSRQETITAEREAIEAVKDAITEVRSYWTKQYAANEGDDEVQDSLVAVRDLIDALEEQYNDSVAADDEIETLWEKHAVSDVEEELLAGLKEAYNKIYNVSDDNAEATEEAKNAAEEAVENLENAIASAEEALADLTNEEDSAAVLAAISKALNALEQAQESIADGESAMGSDADSYYEAAEETAEDAIAALEAAIEAVNGDVPGDLTGGEEGEPDGVVDVFDYQLLLNYVLDPTSLTTEQVAAADLNADGEVNVADLMMLVSYMTTTDNAAIAAHADNNSISAVNGLKLTSEANGATKRIALSLNSSNVYAGAQLDVTLPEGVTIVNEQLADATTDHVVYSNTLANGTHRIVISSLSNSDLNANGEVTLYIDVMGELADRVVVGNVIAADAAGRSYRVTSQGQTTGIEGVSAEMNQGEKVYSVSGQMLDGMKRGVNIVRNADGTTQKVIRK